MKTITTSSIITLDSASLAIVTGGGAKDAAYCSQLRQTGLAFGNGSAGGQVADKAASQLFPHGAPDGFKAALAGGTASALQQFPSPLVASKIADGMPDFCK